MDTHRLAALLAGTLPRKPLQNIPKFAYICTQLLFKCCSKSYKPTMITIKPCIYRHQRRADGTYPVKLRVTLGRVSRTLPTTLIATADQMTRTLKPKDPALAASMEELAASVRRTIAKLSPFAIETMTVDDAVAFIRADQQAQAGIDFFAFAENWIAGKKAGTARNYRVALANLRRFAGPGPLDCRRITRRFAQEWADQIPTPATKRNYTKLIAAIFKAARLRYNDETAGVWAIPQDPFAALQLGRYIPHGQEALDIATIQAIIDATDCTRVQRYALDIFLVSFCTQGANMADLYTMKAPVDGLLRYRRQKVADLRVDGARMVLRVEPCCAALADRMRAWKGGRWLDLADHWSCRESATQGVNRALHGWCERHKIPPFTYYAARHTWATLARSARVGADKALVDEALAHRGDLPLTDIYAERDPSLQWEVNAKVLALFDWSARM